MAARVGGVEPQAAAGSDGGLASTGQEIELPAIRRLKVCLLGGDTFVKSVGKTDVAAAVLRGLTSEQPDEADPVLELAFDCGVFEKAWRELLIEPVDGDGCSQWGTGPVSAWDGRLSFATAQAAKAEAEGSASETASLCAGVPDKLGLSAKRAAGAFHAFKDALVAQGHAVDGFEELHKEMYLAAERAPRELLRRDRPCGGVLATLSRFSPEVGDFSGCGGIVLHIFEPGLFGWNRAQGVAMMCAAAPNGRRHTGLTPRTFLCALRASGSNIIRAVREYNRLVMGKPSPEGWERALWFQADLRAQVESYLCDKNLRTDAVFQGKIAEDDEGWLDLELLKGERRERILDAELLDALGSSKCVETKVSEDGTILIRRAGGKPPPPLDGTDLNVNKRRRVYTPNPARDMDPTCWDFVRKGYCPRGDSCKYLHSSDPVAAKAAAEAAAEGEAGKAQPAAGAAAGGGAGGGGGGGGATSVASAVPPKAAECPKVPSSDIRSPAEMDAELRRALGLTSDADGALAAPVVIEPVALPGEKAAETLEAAS
mmetsp:Transcript_42621/g.97799  ORF Transcript_42621/g.97799 Transcript_42621/m.97799 type:complete len:542 (+) Transcript_42621:96-1721(+)